ncbi:MFS transporter [Paracidovorax anthurii]|uniref:AAHS family 4-hydroxybenzoate transporter-like MFS transporter n=1 Tax=Paracidovorax anthurii TaxID=78229 RepID=A0A328ZMD4_9BURK|nr:aromatic acid/H+ symport family MFS transporter [Paracidovorax anthurii]RAR86575.1 AAHS family 4-hydroxybenzoate transporter-like MFS transporter [Paracidovorax anthurii]
MTIPLTAGASVADRSAFGPLQFHVTLLCAIVAMLDGFDTQSIAYVAPRIAEDWGLKPSDFGPIFAVGLFGLMAGAFILSPAADRWGRKKIILLSTFIFGLFALLTAWATSMTELLAYRFVTGVGLGAAMPNIIALTSEYAPQRLRATLVTVMFCGFPLGSTLGGLVSSWLIARYDWHAVFVLGGVLPLLLLPVLAAMLPESLRYLAASGAAPARYEPIVRRAYPGEDPATVMAGLRGEAGGAGAGFSVFELFRHGRLPTTALLWLAFFMNLLVMYFLVNWLPTLLKGAGLPLEKAILSTAMLNLGGVAGALVLGRLIDRFSPYAVLGAAYAASAGFIALIAFSGQNLGGLLAGAALSGFGVVGAQIGCNALAASIYPTHIRATGVGWALGVGRIGAIVGPLAGGAFLAAAWPASSIILAAAVPALLAAAAVFALGRIRRGAG